MARKKTARAISDKTIQKLKLIYEAMEMGQTPVDARITASLAGADVSKICETGVMRWKAKMEVASRLYHHLKGSRDFENMKAEDLAKLRAAVQAAVMQAFRYLEGHPHAKLNDVITFVKTYLAGLNTKNDWGFSTNQIDVIAKTAAGLAVAEFELVMRAYGYTAATVRAAPTGT